MPPIQDLALHHLEFFPLDSVLVQFYRSPSEGLAKFLLYSPGVGKMTIQTNLVPHFPYVPTLAQMQTAIDRGAISIQWFQFSC